MPVQSELIAFGRNEKQIAEAICADWVVYQVSALSPPAHLLSIALNLSCGAGARQGALVLLVATHADVGLVSLQDLEDLQTAVQRCNTSITSFDTSCFNGKMPFSSLCEVTTARC